MAPRHSMPRDPRPPACGGGKKGDPAAEALGWSRGGTCSKVHLRCENRGLPMVVLLTPGQQHESTMLVPPWSMARCGVPVGGGPSGVPGTWWRTKDIAAPHPPLPAATGHPLDHPPAQGPASGWFLRPRDLQDPQRRGAHDPSPQELPAPGHPLRQAGRHLRDPVGHWLHHHVGQCLALQNTT